MLAVFLAAAFAMREGRAGTAPVPWVEVLIDDGGYLNRKLVPADQAAGLQSENGYYFADRAAREHYLRRTAHLRSKMSWRTARNLFVYLRHQDQIPYAYVKDGCYARAHEMARLLELQGYDSRKIFVVGDLAIPDPVARGKKVDWLFHVAVAVRVEIDGELQDVVMDPSMADRPLGGQEWRALMGKPHCLLVPGSFVRDMDELRSREPGCYYFYTHRQAYAPWSDESQEDWKADEVANARRILRYYRAQLPRR